MEEQKFSTVNEQRYPTIRWTEEADAEKAEKTVFIGNVVQGNYKEKKENVGGNNSTIYLIELTTGDHRGKIVQVWSTTIIKARMDLVPVGSDVRITFNGFKKSKVAGHKPWGDFTVEQAKPVTQFAEVGDAAAAPSTAAAPGEQF